MFPQLLQCRQRCVKVERFAVGGLQLARIGALGVDGIDALLDRDDAGVDRLERFGTSYCQRRTRVTGAKTRTKYG